ncbi:response regulator [Siphonobacter sp. SORGH_AS_0500]|uniref:response regulator n=1 Tax=Siphonobacter sp. SORGH_AS_0500 TaxID=1864824 RepID=UPI002863A8FD|nr:response regulator [Siphonobacter sp. SORGH_AS_0500]MDR6193330.1 CheY-like chemotaxis protein [Siphonobacter sp. SORGH_AS_0500]
MRATPLFLVIEDNSDFCSLLEWSYQKQALPCHLHFLSSAEEALTYIEKAEIHPDLIILDYDLPGINGLEFLDRLRHLKKWKHVPVIVLTIYDDAEIINQAYQRGVNAFVVKPKSYHELTHLWQTLITFWGKHIALGKRTK